LVGLLRDGHVVAIFPEQTRSTDGCLGDLKPGVQMLARRAKVPVVPVLLEGPFEIWPRQRRWPRWTGRLEARFGEPLMLGELPRDEALERLRDAWRALGARGVEQKEAVQDEVHVDPTHAGGGVDPRR